MVKLLVIIALVGCVESEPSVLGPDRLFRCTTRVWCKGTQYRLHTDKEFCAIDDAHLDEQIGDEAQAWGVLHGCSAGPISFCAYAGFCDASEGSP